MNRQITPQTFVTNFLQKTLILYWLGVITFWLTQSMFFLKDGLNF